MNGKGHRRRPKQISEEEMDRRWGKAFGKKEEKKLNLMDLLFLGAKLMNEYEAHRRSGGKEDYVQETGAVRAQQRDH